MMIFKLTIFCFLTSLSPVEFTGDSPREYKLKNVENTSVKIVVFIFILIDLIYIFKIGPKIDISINMSVCFFE